MDNFDSKEYTELYFKPLTLTDDSEETVTTPNFEELCMPDNNTNPRVLLPAAIAKSTILPFENDLQIEVFNKLFQKESTSRRDTYNKLTGHYDSIMSSAQKVNKQMEIYSDNLNGMFINLKAQVKGMESDMLNDSKKMYAKILKKNPSIEKFDQETVKKYLA